MDVPLSKLLLLLNNPLLLDTVVSFLPFRSRLALASTSRGFHDLIIHTPSLLRRLDFMKHGDEMRAFDGLSLERPHPSFLQHTHTLILEGQDFPMQSLKVILLDRNLCIKIVSVLGSNVGWGVQAFQDLAIELAEAYDHDASHRPISGIYYFGMRAIECSLHCPPQYQSL